MFFCWLLVDLSFLKILVSFPRQALPTVSRSHVCGIRNWRFSRSHQFLSLNFLHLQTKFSSQIYIHMQVWAWKYRNNILNDFQRRKHKWRKATFLRHKMTCNLKEMPSWRSSTGFQLCLSVLCTCFNSDIGDTKAVVVNCTTQALNVIFIYKIQGSWFSFFFGSSDTEKLSNSKQNYLKICL